MTSEAEGGLFPYDYCYLWAAGRLALSGQNVYDRSLLAETMHNVGWSTSEGIWGFTHPPWTLWAYLPFSIFSFPVARVLWMVFLVGLLVVVIHQSLKLSRTNPEIIGKLPLPLLAFSLILYPPVLKVFAFGQSSLILIVGLLFYLRFFLEKRHVLAGFSLSLTLMKPHLLVPLYCAVLVSSLRQRDLRLLVGMALGLVGQQLLCTLLYPEGLRFFYDFLPLLSDRSTTFLGATPGQIITFFLGIEWPRILFVVLGVALGLLLGGEVNDSRPDRSCPYPRLAVSSTLPL